VAALRGIVSTISTDFGTLYGARRDLAKAITSSAGGASTPALTSMMA
jgi:hypothetical protein